MALGIPRFMIDRSIMFCSPVTVYTAKRDGTFVARCHAIPGFVAERHPVLVPLAGIKGYGAGGFSPLPRWRSLPPAPQAGRRVEGQTFDETVAAATEAYLVFCRRGIWN